MDSGVLTNAVAPLLRLHFFGAAIASREACMAAALASLPAFACSRPMACSSLVSCNHSFAWLKSHAAALRYALPAAGTWLAICWCSFGIQCHGNSMAKHCFCVTSRCMLSSWPSTSPFCLCLLLAYGMQQPCLLQPQLCSVKDPWCSMGICFACCWHMAHRRIFSRRQGSCNPVCWCSCWFVIQCYGEIMTTHCFLVLQRRSVISWPCTRVVPGSRPAESPAMLPHS